MTTWNENMMILIWWRGIIRWWYWYDDISGKNLLRAGKLAESQHRRCSISSLLSHQGHHYRHQSSLSTSISSSSTTTMWSWSPSSSSLSSSSWSWWWWSYFSLRAIYFASPQLGSSMSASLMSAYYPVSSSFMMSMMIFLMSMVIFMIMSMIIFIMKYDDLHDEMLWFLWWIWWFSWWTRWFSWWTQWFSWWIWW